MWPFSKYFFTERWFVVRCTNWLGDAVTEAELLVLIIWKPTTYNLVVLVRKENR